MSLSIDGKPAKTKWSRGDYDVSRDGRRFLIGTVLDGPHAAPPLR